MGHLLKMSSSGQLDQRAEVEELARVGATEEDIAADLKIPLKRLQKRFRRQLEIGAARGRNQMLRMFFAKAASGDHPQSTTFWLKARCGWRDTGAVTESPEVLHSVVEITLMKDPKPIPANCDNVSKQ